jgi:ubiquitin C-terminal hydrolase
MGIVINRFDKKKSKGNKSIHKVDFDREKLVTSNKYNLIGSIHHHGNTITSGHYTSNIFYAECAYICNDIHIVPLNRFEPANSVYIWHSMRAVAYGRSRFRGWDHGPMAPVQAVLRHRVED